VSAARAVPAWIWIWLLAGTAGAVALAAPKVRLPSDDPGLRRFQTPDIRAETTISQTFVMTAQGLQAIDLRAVQTGPVSGLVHLELRELIRGTSVVQRRADVPAATLVATSSYRFAFAPIADSRGLSYRLDVAGDAEQPPGGVALVATKGNRYSEGTMLVNGTERWADLAFRAVSPEGQSGWTKLRSVQAREPGVSRADVILAGLAGYWILFGILLRAVWPASHASRP
jgi:hypothetical protein